MISFFLDQYGCAKNQIDGELIISRLIRSGLTRTDSPQTADIIIINSCGFIESAKKESLAAVMETRAAFPKAKILLAGCLAERYADAFSSDLPEVDGIAGNGDLAAVEKAVTEILHGKRPVIKPAQQGVSCGIRSEFLSFPGSAFVKITEGCDNRCSFCAIPLIRGRLRSRPADDIIAEIQDLLDRGIFEINLVGQDSAAFGMDGKPPHDKNVWQQFCRNFPAPEQQSFYSGAFGAGIPADCGYSAGRTSSRQTLSTGGPADSAGLPQSAPFALHSGAAADDSAPALKATDSTAFGADIPAGQHSPLAELLYRISQLPGRFWLRLLYIHPDHFPLDILPVIAADPRILPYFDIPFQSGSNKIIHAMNRTGTAGDYIRLIHIIRQQLHNSPHGAPALRTTFLCGFPGETPEDADETERFLETIQPDWSGAFEYSREEDTPAAVLPRQVPGKTAANRSHRLQEIQTRITAAALEKRLGAETDILIEEIIEGGDGEGTGLAIGRAWFQAPDVDGAIVVRYEPEQEARIIPGKTVRVRLCSTGGVDITGDLLE